MLRRLRYAPCLAMLAIFAPPAAGQDVDLFAGMDIVVAPPSYAGCSDPAYAFDALECHDIGSTETAGLAVVWVLLTRWNGTGFDDGVGGVQFGLRHAVSMVPDTWTHCTGGSQIPQDDLFGTWPESGTGNAVTWAGGCYVPANDVARIGFFGVENGDAGCVVTTADPRIGTAGYADCSAVFRTIRPECLTGAADLGAHEVHCGCTGFLPCDAVPVRASGWRQLKQMFGG